MTKEPTPFNDTGLEIRRGIYLCHDCLAVSSAEVSDAKHGCKHIRAAWKARELQDV